MHITKFFCTENSFMCIIVELFCLHVYMYTMCVPKKVTRGHHILWDWNYNVFEPPYGCSELKQGPLQKQDFLKLIL